MDFWASLWDFVGFFFWTMVLVSYLYALFPVIADVFRDREMSGWGRKPGGSSSCSSYRC